MESFGLPPFGEYISTGSPPVPSAVSSIWARNPSAASTLCAWTSIAYNRVAERVICDVCVVMSGDGPQGDTSKTDICAESHKYPTVCN